jgi:peptidoglycan/LPS O-acetylase OafA/YrhL
VLGKTYSAQFLLQAFFGIFTEANMLTDFNSPLWYFTLILFYYLVFPIVFSKKWPWVTAIILYFAVRTVVQIDPPHFAGVIGLYEVHMLAFPLGIISAWLLSTQKNIIDSITDTCTKYARIAHPIAMATLLGCIGYFGIHSDVGDFAYLEQQTSLLIMTAVLFLFIIKKRESKLMSLFGLFSYEIYLFHWPILVRYDVLYVRFEPWLATLLYLGFFILLAMLLQRISSTISKKIGL